MPIPAATIQPSRLSDYVESMLHAWWKDQYQYKRREQNALSYRS